MAVEPEFVTLLAYGVIQRDNQLGPTTTGMAETRTSYILSLVTPGSALADTSSILIYCAFRHDADVLAAKLQAIGHRAKSYHAGKHYKVSVRLGLGVCRCL